ncbi:unnamed protein product [Agarophyton chilense]
MQALSTRVQRHAVPLKPVDVSDSYGFKTALYVVNALSKRTGESAYTEQEARVKVANLIQDSDVERLSLLLRQWYSEDYDEAVLKQLLPELANRILTNDVSRYDQRAIVNDIEWSALATAFKCCIAVKMVRSESTKGNGWKIAVPTPQIFGQSATRADEDTQCVFVVCQVVHGISRYVALIPNSQPIFKPGRALVASKSAYEARTGKQKVETAISTNTETSEVREVNEATEAKSESEEPQSYQHPIRLQRLQTRRDRSFKMERKVSFNDESRTSGESFRKVEAHAKTAGAAATGAAAEEAAADSAAAGNATAVKAATERAAAEKAAAEKAAAEKAAAEKAAAEKAASEKAAAERAASEKAAAERAASEDAAAADATGVRAAAVEETSMEVTTGQATTGQAAALKAAGTDTTATQGGTETDGEDGTVTEPASSEGGSEAGDSSKVPIKAVGYIDEQLLLNMDDLKLLSGHISLASEGERSANMEPSFSEGSAMYEMRLLFQKAFPETTRRGGANFLN